MQMAPHIVSIEKRRLESNKVCIRFRIDASKDCNGTKGKNADIFVLLSKWKYHPTNENFAKLTFKYDRENNHLHKIIIIS